MCCHIFGNHFCLFGFLNWVSKIKVPQGFIRRHAILIKYKFFSLVLTLKPARFQHSFQNQRFCDHIFAGKVKVFYFTPPSSEPAESRIALKLALIFVCIKKLHILISLFYSMKFSYKSSSHLMHAEL